MNQQKTYQEATRMASFGLLLFATFALISGVVAPHLLIDRSKNDTYIKLENQCVEESMPIEVPNHGIIAGKGQDGRILCAWAWTQILFATCILSTFFVKSLWGTYILVGLCGISWGITIWAPFSLISMAIQMENKCQTDLSGCYQQRSANSDDIERRPGIIMALHNTAISAPQIVVIIISSIVFRLCSTGRGGDYDQTQDGVAWILRITALSAIVAAIIVYQELR